MMNASVYKQISIFFGVQANPVQNLCEIVNKSQLTLYKSVYMTYRSRKESTTCKTLSKKLQSLPFKSVRLIYSFFVAVQASLKEFRSSNYFLEL